MKKYPQKNIVFEKSNQIQQALQDFENQDINIKIFAKIFRNECDELFISSLKET